MCIKQEIKRIKRKIWTRKRRPYVIGVSCAVVVTLLITTAALALHTTARSSKPPIGTVIAQSGTVPSATDKTTSPEQNTKGSKPQTTPKLQATQNKPSTNSADNKQAADTPPVDQSDPTLILRYTMSDVSGGFITDDTSDTAVYTGTLVNFPATLSYMPGPGNKGQALVFQRASQQRIDTPTYNLTISKFTFAAWAYIAEDDTPENNWEVGERGGGFWLNVRNSEQGHILRLGLFAGGNQRANMYQADSLAAVPRSQWVHLAGTFDGSTMRVYINGQLAGSRTGITGALYQPVPDGDFPGEPLRIGAKLTTTSVATGQNWWQGALSDVRLYNRALSDSEIAGLATIN